MTQQLFQNIHMLPVFLLCINQGMHPTVHVCILNMDFIINKISVLIIRIRRITYKIKLP